MKITTDLSLPETALRGILEEADRVHLPIEIERRLGIEVLGFGSVARRGRASWSLLRLRSCSCGYGTVVWRRRLSPPALALRCRHALASRASGGSRPWSRRGFDARAVGWHAVSGGRAAPIMRGIVPYRPRCSWRGADITPWTARLVPSVSGT